MPHPAVLSREPRICVIAAPGSGKSTSIIIPRSVSLINDDAVPVGELLLMSFSRLSALDLKQKVAAEVINAPRATTVHSYALSFLLSEDNHGIRVRVDSILLAFQRDFVISDVKLIFPAVNRRILKKRLDEFAAGWAIHPQDQVFEANEDQRRFKAAVVGWLAEHEAAMMEEIMHHAVALALQLPQAEMLQTPRHVMVDEYQDLNQLEQEFVRLLTQNATSTLIVGDPDQSIYGFKYAYPNGIRDFHARNDVDRYSSLTTYRCPRAVVAAANSLLVQAAPGRRELVETHANGIDGETHFVRRAAQDGEFDYVLRSIAARLAVGTQPAQILVLTPKRKLASVFAEYADSNRLAAGVPDGVRFAAIQKEELTLVEQERLLMLGLVAKPNSLLHIRTYLGLGDDSHYASELRELSQRYGGLRQVVAQADQAHFPRSLRRRQLSKRAVVLREFLARHQGEIVVEDVLNEVAPAGNPDTADLRAVVDELREPEDSVADILRKHLEHRRNLPEDANTVRCMTLMASKGLGAQHVFIVACNAGNIPGPNRSSHMSAQDHRLEQLRLLYVGFTRATQSLTVSWSTQIPYDQAQGLQTPIVRTRRIGGRMVGIVGLSEFLQNIPNIAWE